MKLVKTLRSDQGSVVGHRYKLKNLTKFPLRDVWYSIVLNTGGAGDKYQARKLNGPHENDLDNGGHPKNLPDVPPNGVVEFDSYYTLQDQDPDTDPCPLFVSQLVHPRFTVDSKDDTKGERLVDVFTC